jgi:hypothetical protein
MWADLKYVYNYLRPTPSFTSIGLAFVVVVTGVFLWKTTVGQPKADALTEHSQESCDK